jgi:hypothetical protein
MLGATIHFTINGRSMVGVHTATDYEEIEVTTADGEQFYLPDEYLDQATTAAETVSVGMKPEGRNAPSLPTGDA